jgi:hypothetical protein
MLFLDTTAPLDRLLNAPAGTDARLTLDEFIDLLGQIRNRTPGQWRNVTFKVGKKSYRFPAEQLTPAEFNECLYPDGEANGDGYFVGHALMDDRHKNYRCAWSMARTVLGGRAGGDDWDWREWREVTLEGGMIRVTLFRLAKDGQPAREIVSPPVPSGPIGIVWCAAQGLKLGYRQVREAA